MPGLGVVKILLVGRGAVDLQNFRAQVAHINATRNRVGAIHRILIHNVGIAGFKLNFCQCLEKVAGVNVFLRTRSSATSSSYRSLMAISPKGLP